jgi:HAD superfamily hydrolase (TIGR01509 family)
MNNVEAAAVIFDMDGVLIDSEPFWKQAEVEIFGSVGVPITLEMCAQTTGFRMDAAVDYWYERYPWKGPSKKEIEYAIKERVCALILDCAEAKEGALDILHGIGLLGIPLAICSSSPLFIIEAVCQKLNIRKYFKVLQTAEDCEFGKPHPEPYLFTAKRLGLESTRCIVIEDSLTGAISAKAARMKVIAVPEKDHALNSKFDFCDYRFTSLAQMTPRELCRMAGIEFV